MPQMYLSTGSHSSTVLRSVGAVLIHGSVKRAKYQDESTNVSMVSVSRRAGPAHFGHFTFFQVGWRSSGVPGLSKVTSCGNVTGRSLSGTWTTPHFSQWMMGIGQPQ